MKFIAPLNAPKLLIIIFFLSGFCQASNLENHKTFDNHLTTTMQGQNDTINGNVTSLGDPVDTGEVKLWRFDSNNMVYNLVDSYAIQQQTFGKFKFLSPQSGKYILRAVPDSSSSTYDNVVPAYHTSALSWKNAQEVIIKGDSGKTYIADIELPNTQKDTGQGRVSGKITEAGPRKRPGPGDPQGGIEILLTKPNGTPVEFDVTNQKGQYEFTNLAYGNYTVQAEIPSFNTTKLNVELDSTNQARDSVNFEVDKDNRAIISSLEEKQSSTSELKKLQVYPNPVTNEMNIKVQATEKSRLTLRLRNEKGELVKAKTVDVRPGPQQIAMEISQVSNGVYFLSGEKGGELVYEPIQILKVGD